MHNIVQCCFPEQVVHFCCVNCLKIGYYVALHVTRVALLFISYTVGCAYILTFPVISLFSPLSNKPLLSHKPPLPFE